MRDDLLKEQLMSYARSGAEEAFQPAAAAIHRRARRHYQRVAALTVAGVVLAVGLGVGIGLRRDGGTPTVDQPVPTLTSPGPAVPSTRPPATSNGRLPETFVGGIDNRVAVLSTATGKIVRTLWTGPAGGTVHGVGLSPDRSTVYFSAGPVDPCERPGIYRAPSAGGPVQRIVTGESASGRIATSADGSRLAYLAYPCPSAGEIDVVLRDATGGLVRRWSRSPADQMLAAGISLSPDGRRVAVPVLDQLDPVGVRLLDATKGTTVADGRLIRAPDRGCGLVSAVFEPRTGRLAGFERCLPADLQSDTPPRFRLVHLDPDSGRLLGRSFAFDDTTGADLTVNTMDFDQGGRHLLYWVGSHDPADSQAPRPATGTWRSSDGGRPVRIQDDWRTADNQRHTSSYPSW